MKQIKTLVLILLVVGLILFFFWIARFLGSGEKIQSEKPIVICQPQNAPPQEQRCFWTAHIHAEVKVFKGNMEIPIGFEKGTLEEEHTHAEANTLHWHGLIPVDPVSKEVKDWSVLRVGNIPRDLKLSVAGTPKFTVNGKEVEPSYIWQDGDAMEIDYE